MKAAAYFLFLPVTVSFNEQSLFLSFSFALTMDWRNKSPGTEAEQLFLFSFFFFKRPGFILKGFLPVFL